MTDPDARPDRLPPSYRDDPAATSRPVPAAWRAQQPRTVVVDGETFVVTPRPSEPGTYDFDWISGPNEGYGFGSSSRGHVLSLAEMRESIRNFLDQVDPDTGYLADNDD